WRDAGSRWRHCPRHDYPLLARWRRHLRGRQCDLFGGRSASGDRGAQIVLRGGRVNRGVLVLGVAAIGVGAWWAVDSAARTPLVGVGSPAPDFRAATLEEPPRTRTLADYRGEVVLLNLWATWCGPCEWEMP